MTGTEKPCPDTDGGAAASAATNKAKANLRIARDFTISVLDEVSGVRFDAARGKCAEQTPPQLVGDLALIERRRLELGADGHRPVGQRLDAENFDRRHHQRAPL